VERGSAGSRESRCTCENARAPEILSKGFPALSLNHVLLSVPFTQHDSFQSARTRLRVTSLSCVIGRTGWRRPIECLIFIGHFSQKSPIICGSFAKSDLQVTAFYYRVANTHRMPSFYRSFSAQEPYN